MAYAVNPRRVAAERGVAMRRLIALVVLTGLTLLGLAAVGGPGVASDFPGTNGKIAFVGHAIFTVDPDGTHKAQIGGSFCPAWSPDGSKLLVCVFLPQGARPATANPDGSDFTLLDHYPGRQLGLGCNSWSPNGTRLLCNSNDQDGNTDQADDGLYTVRSSDGGGLARVTVTPKGFLDSGLGYSPDGSRILFDRINQSNDHGGLFTVKPNGTGLLRLSPPRLSIIDLDFSDGTSADWSPDNSRVTFPAQNLAKPRFRTALFVVNADGTGLHQITPSGVGAISAQWSPDGQRIAFTSCCGNLQAWVVRPDGTGLVEITNAADGSLSWSAGWTPVWSPDSTKLLLQRSHRVGRVALWTVNADGTGLSKLTRVPDLTSYSWGTAPVG